jgi:hypothetical protein
MVCEARTRSHRRCSGRRPERYRHLFAGGCAIRLQHAVDRPANVSTDGRHSRREREDRAGERPWSCDESATPLSALAAVRHGRPSAGCEHDQHCSRPDGHGGGRQSAHRAAPRTLTRSDWARFHWHCRCSCRTADMSACSSGSPSHCSRTSASSSRCRSRGRPWRCGRYFRTARGAQATSRRWSPCSGPRSARTCSSGRRRRKSKNCMPRKDSRR